MIKTVLLRDYFKIKAGDYHATSELSVGNIPLISCGNEDNGLVGYFDIPKENTYANLVTVAFNGIPLTAKYHPYIFGAKDDVAVLIPQKKLNEKTLIYVAAQLDNQKWRYSYGRKCFRNKLEKLEVDLPVDSNKNIDEDYINKLTKKTISRYIPRTNPVKYTIPSKNTTKIYRLSEIFTIKNGEFHKVDGLEKGNTPLISCSEEENGVAGYYNILKQHIFKNALTVTFDGRPLTVKYHRYEFGAYDNVGILLPKIILKETTLIYIATLIAKQQWRYSYGRKCYQNKIQNLTIELPIINENSLNEKLISNIVFSVPYSDFVLA